MLPDRRELFLVGRRSVLNAPNTRINPAVIDIPGSDINILLGAMSVMGEDVVAALASCMRGLFIDTARGDALDRVAFDRYGLTRFAATPSTVQLRLFRSSTAFGGFTYPAGSRVQTPSGLQFATDVNVVFGALDTEKVVNATALTSGPDSNTSSSTITQYLDQPADSSLRVTNTLGAAGGADAESDVEFRGRCREFFPTVRRGTLGAIQFGALQVPGVAVASAIEVTNPCGGEALPACSVQLIVADRLGGFSVPMRQAVIDKMIEFRAAGIPVDVQGGIVQPQAVTWNIDAEAGVDAAQVLEEVRAVTVAVAQFLRPGQALRRADLIAGAKTVPGAIVLDNSLVAPALDIVPTVVTTILRVQPQGVTFVD